IAFLILFSILSQHLFSQSIEGEWYGTLDAMGTKVPLVLHLSESEGVLTGTMDSPQQGGYGIPMDEVRLTGNQFFFSINQAGIKYTGTLSKLGLSGDFNQAGFDFDLEFTREPPAANGQKKREQDPVDFPYRRLAVTFPSGAEAITMAGELTLPPTGTAIKQAVILISGSGGQDRNSELGEAINHRPFLVLSDFLTREGIAVLRYDDRGIGASTGNFSQATTADFAQDAEGALSFLAAQPELKDAKLGLIGHSEGGLIVPMVAAERDDLDFVVLLGAPGIPADTLMLMQSRLVQESMGAPLALIERNLKPIRKAYAYINGHPELEEKELQEELIEIFRASIKDLPQPLQDAIQDEDAFARQQVGTLSNIWFRYFLSFDPEPYLKQLTAPILALNGDLDTQVPSKIFLYAIAKHVVSNCK
ncbi:MAG: alpha/beta hydrolase, partial [Bacteroidota bacterium]